MVWAGIPKLVQHYRNGILDGPEQKWFPGGAKFSESTYVNGRKDGQYTEWFINGKPKYSAIYKNGELSGPFHDWFADGAVKAEGAYIDGVPDGAGRNGSKRSQTPRRTRTRMRKQPTPASRRSTCYRPSTTIATACCMAGRLLTSATARNDWM